MSSSLYCSTASRSNSGFDQLAVEQYSELDPQKRLDLLYRMQQIFYVEAPYVVIDYPDTLEAVNTAKWDGWTRFMGGPAFYSQFNMDSYLNLRPKAGTAEIAVSESATWLIVAVAVLAVLVSALVVWMVRRGRGRALEE